MRCSRAHRVPTIRPGLSARAPRSPRVGRSRPQTPWTPVQVTQRLVQALIQASMSGSGESGHRAADSRPFWPRALAVAQARTLDSLVAAHRHSGELLPGRVRAWLDALAGGSAVFVHPVLGIIRRCAKTHNARVALHDPFYLGGAGLLRLEATSAHCPGGACRSSAVHRAPYSC